MWAHYNLTLNCLNCRLHFFEYLCIIHIFGMPHVRFVCHLLQNFTFGLAPSSLPTPPTHHHNHTATNIILVPPRPLLWKGSPGRKKDGNGNYILRSLLRITKHFFILWLLWNSNANMISIYNLFSGYRNLLISQSILYTFNS